LSRSFERALFWARPERQAQKKRERKTRPEIAILIAIGRSNLEDYAQII